jgi:hypothetical protein
MRVIPHRCRPAPLSASPALPHASATLFSAYQPGPVLTVNIRVNVVFNPKPAPPTLNHTWQSIAPYGADWGVTQSLAPGESLTLTSGGPYYDDGSHAFPAGARVYAYVDSVNYDTTYGNVRESNEANNVFGPVVSTAGTQAAGAVQTDATSPRGLPGR